MGVRADNGARANEHSIADRDWGTVVKGNARTK
jgi:hypothetical protein